MGYNTKDVQWIGKVTSKNNPENIFVVPMVAFPQNGLQAKINNTIYDITFRSIANPMTAVVEVPAEVSLNVGDEVIFKYFDLKSNENILKLPNCNNHIVTELNDGTCYYSNNQISIFPFDQNVQNTVTDPMIFLTPAVFGEFLFATLYEFIPVTINHYMVNIYHNNQLYKKDVQVFSNEQVGINYQAFMNGTIDDMYYGDIRLRCVNDDVSINEFGFVESDVEETATKLSQTVDTQFSQQRKFNINQYIMNEFQNNIDLSIKVIESDPNNSLMDANFVTYKKYANTYDHIALSNGIFDDSNVYQKIKNNIDQNGFTSIEDYESIPDATYSSECICQSDIGQFNYANEDIYLLHTSKFESVSEDSTIDLDLLPEFTDISMVLKLSCAADATSYTVQNAFIVPQDLSGNFKNEIIKVDDDKYYYCNSTMNMLIDFVTGDILFQRVITEINTDGVITGESAAYKYAPMIYDGEWILYEVPNYETAYGKDIYGYSPVVYDYKKIREITDPKNTFGYKPAYISSNLCITDVLFDSNHTDIYLKLNKYMQFYNYENLKLYNILDDNVVTYQNGTTTLLTDDTKTIKLHDKFYLDTHSVFNDSVIAILNVKANYDSTTGSYTTEMNYDVFGDSIYMTELFNTSNISNLLDLLNENETLFMLLTKDDDVVAGTIFEIYPKNIIIKATFETVELDGEEITYVVITYPSHFLNFDDDIINKYYRYRQVNRFKSDYLDNVFYLTEA